MSQADVIDYKIGGEDIQYVEVELDPGESVVSEAGAMMYKSPSVTMEAVFGDGSKQNSGVWGALAGAGKRLLTGESLFMTVFTHQGQGKAHAAFAAPFPGTIIPVHLPDLGGELICQKDSFLAAAKGVSIGIALLKRIMTGLFGGEGFIMQRLQGTGWCFVHAGGTLIKKDLAPGEEIHIDTGCVVAYTPDVEFEIERAGVGHLTKDPTRRVSPLPPGIRPAPSPSRGRWAVCSCRPDSKPTGCMIYVVDSHSHLRERFGHHPQMASRPCMSAFATRCAKKSFRLLPLTRR